VLAVRNDDTAAAQRIEQALDGRAYRRRSVFALIPAPGDDQDLVGSLDLLLTEPGVDSHRRGVDGRERLAEIKCSLVAETRFIERAMQFG
jgi:hypothetical protein